MRKMNLLLRTRNLLMILLGVSGLLLKRWFSGSFSELAYSYLGNFAVSYAVYFLVTLAVESRINRAASALIALAVVEAFELTGGFGLMTNVYDPWDYLANALGVALAYLVDGISTRWILAASRES